MKQSVSTSLLWLAILVPLLVALTAFAESNVRIVRLSDVEGSVQIDRGTGQGFEKAFLNMPITEGVKLKAGDDGRAEVEFEDNTLMHLVPKTMLEFTELTLRDSGGKISTVDLESGEAYVYFAGKRDDEFTVTFAHEKTTLTHAAHLRVKVGESTAELAVFDGDVQVDGPAGEIKLSKKQTVTFDLNEDQYSVAKKVEQDPLDAWDKHEEQYHQRYEASTAYSSPYSYGLSDLNYYGNYMTVPGYGLCWQPYFIGMGWNPYMDGAWMLYPGFGYSWVSAYPWGWMPYHSGSWLFVPSYGWMWQPGTNWVVWNRIPAVINPPRNYVPPRPPVINQPGMVRVGRGPTSSTLAAGTRAGSKLVLDAPLAGIGIPRGVENLGRANRAFQSHGQARIGLPGGVRGAAMTATPVPRGGRGMTMPAGGGHWGSASTGHAASSSGHASGPSSHR